MRIFWQGFVADFLVRFCGRFSGEVLWEIFWRGFVADFPVRFCGRFSGEFPGNSPENTCTMDPSPILDNSLSRYCPCVTDRLEVSLFTFSRKVIKKFQDCRIFPAIFLENHQKISRCPDFSGDFPGKSPENLKMPGFFRRFSWKITRKSLDARVFPAIFLENHQKISRCPGFSGDFPGKSPENRKTSIFPQSHIPIS